ncbi:tetratricopeptide repeat protein [Thalassotalea profundi]|uniref:Sel1 repeat family protein n=1 Tax=Thalassotalea profundi TaxID=2036687 RepID=A0ABQ3ISD9_9GAMM|nr:sel1 repeat family protein [Thalassotalea profundi]GHE90236.1 hypothetical protein GCM10011501_19540 [Thalassotalea profundi]
MYVKAAMKQIKILSFPKLSIPLKIPTLLLFVLGLYLGYLKYSAYQLENHQTLAIISAPKIDDIYFLDFRLLSNKLRPTEKYRIAKVVDITGDIITLVYGSLYYQRKHSAINSIKYGQLSYKDYFETKRYNLPLTKIRNMHQGEIIYLAKRPTRKKLYGNLVSPEIMKPAASPFIYGRSENIKGEAFLIEQHSEINFKTAFELFQQSSELGYVEGQINLAEMYINALYTPKNLNKALFWLKQASLQSSKAAILKYEIICKQVPECNIYNFFKELTNAGVNVKVRKLDFELTK